MSIEVLWGSGGYSISLSDITIYYDSEYPSNCVSSIDMEIDFLEIVITSILLIFF